MTDFLISRCNEILLSEIGIAPEKSVYRLHDNDSWKRLSEDSGMPDGCLGVYFPRDLSANVREDSEYLPINMMHEYFGHGLFCEYSEPGKKLVRLEKELEGIEYNIRVSSEDSSPHIQVSRDNPFFEEYLRKRDETFSVMLRTYPLYEGFALWMEHYLAQAIASAEMFDEKLERFITPYQKGLFTTQLAFCEKHGKNALLDRIGFS
jgi:hypothetical protein